ncbi:MAG: adenosylcobinamide-phosphate synthase CbiB [Pseudomonadota bacterium]
MSVFTILALALILDALFGEPRWLWDRIPHPAVLMGRAIELGDNSLNRGAAQRLTGVILMLLLVLAALGLGLLFQSFGWLAEVILAAILLAHRSLVEHVKAVAHALRVSLGDGQKSVAMIVGRDTTDMTQSDVSRAAIESAAENFSDGVIAPAFWFLIGGLPGLFIYKITNTADSMIGYRTPRHEAFGWAAARFDDLLNLVPARLTAAVLALIFGQLSAWRDIQADARLHRSPNAGWPEAAMARGLDVSLAGPRSYDGELRDFPFVHAHGRKNASPAEIDSACRALWMAWGSVFLYVSTLALVM